MRKLLGLCLCWLACESHVFGFGVSVIVVNVGTNSCSESIQQSASLSGGVPAGVLLAGQTGTNTDGGQGSPYYVEWSAAGQVAAFIVEAGNPSGPSQPPAILGPIPICAQGIPTNCTDTVAIANNGISAETYQLLYGGTPAGTITVLGGSTQKITVSNPDCIPGKWAFYMIPGYIDLTGPGYHPYNPNIGPGDNQVLPANSTTSLSASPGNPTPVQTQSQYPIAPYTNAVAFTNSNTNGPIAFGTNGNANPTNLANNGTIQASANALYTATVQSEQGVVDAVHTLDLHNQEGSAGVSNAIGQVVQAIGTNTATNVAMWSNYMDLLTNTNHLTLSGILASEAGSQADSASAAGQTALQGVGDSVASIAAPTIPSVGDYTITIGSGAMLQTVDINPLSTTGLFPEVADICPWVRTLSQWGLTFWFLIWLVDEINTSLRSAFNAPQSVSGDAVPVLAETEGFVIGAVVAIGMSVLITAAITYVTGGLVSAFLAHPFDGSGPQAVQSGVAWLDAVFDIGMCLTYAAQRVSIPFYLTKFMYRLVIFIRMLS